MPSGATEKDWITGFPKIELKVEVYLKDELVIIIMGYLIIQIF